MPVKRRQERNKDQNLQKIEKEGGVYVPCIYSRSWQVLLRATESHSLRIRNDKIAVSLLENREQHHVKAVDNNNDSIFLITDLSIRHDFQMRHECSESAQERRIALYKSIQQQHR